MKHIILLLLTVCIAYSLMAQTEWQRIPLEKKCICKVPKKTPNDTAKNAGYFMPDTKLRPVTIKCTEYKEQTVSGDTTFVITHKNIIERIYTNDTVETIIFDTLRPYGIFKGNVDQMNNIIDTYLVSKTINNITSIIYVHNLRYQPVTPPGAGSANNHADSTSDTQNRPVPRSETNNNRTIQMHYNIDTTHYTFSYPLADLGTSVNIPADYSSLNFLCIKRNDTTLSNHKLKKIHDDIKLTWKTGYWYMCMNGMPSFAIRTIIINDYQFNNNNVLDMRHRTESAIFGGDISLAVGRTINKSHTLFAEYIHLWQGFQSQNTAIDWHSGLAASIPGKADNYTFSSNGFGIGYNYSAFHRTVNPTFETKLLFTWVSNAKDNDSTITKSERRLSGLNDHTIAFSAGAGIAIRPRYWCEIKILPLTFLYDFSNINSGDLKTKLMNIGMTVGYTIRFGFR